MRKKILSILIVICMIFLIVGCSGQNSGNEDGPEKTKAPDTPAIQDLDWEEMHIGGVETEGANIKSVSARQDGEEYVIEISFIYGSKYSEIDEAKMDAVPTYRTYGLSSPARLVVEFPNMAHWDWENALDEVFPEDMFYGVFSKIPYESSPYTLFFQIKQGCTYSIEENSDVLSIRLKPTASGAEDRKFCVTLDAFYDYQEGMVHSDWGFMPTLCDDEITRTLISNPYQTREEAETILNNAANDMPRFGRELFRVIEVVGNRLPIAEEQTSNSYQRPMVKVAGVEKEPDMINANGIYTGSTPDGKTMIFSTMMDMDGQGSVYEILKRVELNGKSQQLSDFEFYTVIKTAFSPDGKKLAVIDMSADGYTLYCLDMVDGGIISLNEEGIDSFVLNCTWSSDSNTLYCIAGEIDQFIYRYDFDKPYGERVQLLTDECHPQGQIEIQNGVIYYDAVSQNGEQIEKYHIEDGVRTKVAAGTQFKISVEQKLAIVEEVIDEELMQVRAKLSIVDVNGENAVTVEPGVNLMDYQWSVDGNKLYYIKSGSNDPEYPYILCAFDLQTQTGTELALTRAQQFYTTRTANELLLVDYVSDAMKYVTYKLDLTKL